MRPETAAKPNPPPKVDRKQLNKTLSRLAQPNQGRSPVKRPAENKNPPKPKSRSPTKVVGTGTTNKSPVK